MAENVEDFNIVDNEASIDNKKNLQDTVYKEDPKDPLGDNVEERYGSILDNEDSYNITKDNEYRIEDESINIDLDYYRDNLDTEDIYMPKGISMDYMNRAVANNQSFSEQAGNFLAQTIVGEIVGGTIEGVGYLLDFKGMHELITGKESDYTNWLSDIGKSIRSSTEENFEIHEMEPGEMNLWDSGYWFKNGVSIASSLSMMLPSMAGARAARMLGKGISKVAGKGIRSSAKTIGKEIAEEAADLSKRMSVQAEWVADGMSQAVISRHIENSMEASGTYEDVYNTRISQINPKTGVNFTDEEAKISASEAAADNYKHGWLMLAQDMVQYIIKYQIIRKKQKILLTPLH